MRIRRDVWNLTRTEGDWPQVLVAYERAVETLRSNDPPAGPPANPLGWRYLAAMHGLAAADGITPDTTDPLWSNCQHGSWYFLPWHRMYLRAFELIVQDALEDPEWSLPYWYAIDPDDEDRSILPPAFRDETPGNDLFTTARSMPANGGRRLPDFSGDLLAALVADTFSTPDGTSTFGGGERATPSFDGLERGLLEDVPHGVVHALVGNDYDRQGKIVRRGWMGSFFTAGLDPVFWLHHANIDRLWDVWLEAGPAHVNPTGDPAWFDATFSFPAVGGGLETWSIGEVLDAARLGYEYESTALPAGVPAVAPVGIGPDIGLGEAAMPARVPPQVLGTTVGVSLATDEAAEVELSEPVDLSLGAGGAQVGERVFLRIEGITGTAAAPAYRVYLNVPPGETPEEHPELAAGTLSTFGMAESSQRNQLSDGSGISTVLDVTSVRDKLEELGRWDPSRLRISFRPVIPEPAQADEADQGATADIHASQISVIAG